MPASFERVPSGPGPSSDLRRRNLMGHPPPNGILPNSRPPASRRRQPFSKSRTPGAIDKRPPPRARPLSHIRVYRKRARPLREKRQKEYMRVARLPSHPMTFVFAAITSPMSPSPSQRIERMVHLNGQSRKFGTQATIERRASRRKPRSTCGELSTARQNGATL